VVPIVEEKIRGSSADEVVVYVLEGKQEKVYKTVDEVSKIFA